MRGYLRRFVAFAKASQIEALSALSVLPRRLYGDEAAAIAGDFAAHLAPVTDVQIGAAIVALLDRPPAPAEIAWVRRLMVTDQAQDNPYEAPGL